MYSEQKNKIITIKRAGLSECSKLGGRGALYVEMDLTRTFLVDRMKKQKQSQKFSDETLMFSFSFNSNIGILSYF